MKERQRWQPEEDALLRAYVKQHGAKEWNMVSQRMGKPQVRDAKSCLERWKNYLKPGIKKGSLTEEEQSLVISLQAKYGNKWKKIASEVPGRTAKRLGKWWEVFKEKQRKALLQDQPLPSSSATGATSAASQLEESAAAAAVQSKYDHILETFAEKYVQPKLKEPPAPNFAPMPNISLDPSPILSLGTATAPPEISGGTTTQLPPWMSSSSSNSTSCSSSTVSPSVSLSLSPTEPPASPELSRFLPVQQLSAVAQCVKELDEGRMGWALHKKEATWRLSRLEQQLESEKARKKREKMEEIEARIRSLREEELVFVERIDNECREQLSAIQRDAEIKEAKMVELWISKHVKLAKLIEQMGFHHCNPPTN